MQNREQPPVGRYAEGEDAQRLWARVFGIDLDALRSQRCTCLAKVAKYPREAVEETVDSVLRGLHERRVPAAE